MINSSPFNGKEHFNLEHFNWNFSIMIKYLKKIIRDSQFVCHWDQHKI